MNCVNHSAEAAVAYCRTCGKALCNACARNVGGVVYCETCAQEVAPARQGVVGVLPNAMHSNRRWRLAWADSGRGRHVQRPVHEGDRPSRGVRGDRVDGGSHRSDHGPCVLRVFLLLRLRRLQDGVCPGSRTATAGSVWTGIALWAGSQSDRVAAAGGRIQRGNPAPGVPGQQPYQPQPGPFAAPGAGNGQACDRGPVAAIILIGLGCVFLLHSMGWFSFSVDRFWPVILIVIGVWMFFKRWNRVS